jgi:DNA-binding NarL/FixJ family response regulator
MSHADKIASQKPVVLTIDDSGLVLKSSTIPICKLAGYTPAAVLAAGDPANETDIEYGLNDVSDVPALLERIKPAAIITDFDMLTFTAADFIEAVRAVKGYEDTPILIYSGAERHEITAALKKKGIDPASVQFFPKDGEMKELKDTISALVGHDSPPLPPR